MISSIVGASYETADAVVVGVPYGCSASFGSGAENGPIRIKEMLDEQIEIFDRFSKTEPAYDKSFAITILDDVQRFAPEQMVKEVTDFLRDEQRFVVIVGGVHSVSIPALNALSERYDPKEITIVQIDAHFDLRDDDSEYNEVDPSRFAHSTVMRRAHELGFNILPVGIRTMFRGEYEYAQKNRINYFEWGRLDLPTPSIDQVIEEIKTDKVYLTIDVDGFDPSVMPATGTPMPGGLSWEYGQALIREIMKEKEVVGADVVEVAPLEFGGQTECAAAQLVYHILTLAKI